MSRAFTLLLSSSAVTDSRRHGGRASALPARAIACGAAAWR
jgi:hypothetical protein